MFVFLIRYLVVVCGGVAVVFRFFVAPSLAVFNSAVKFNQDVSKWNTGAVTNMAKSKCTLSPSLWPRLPLLRFLNIRQLTDSVSSYVHSKCSLAAVSHKHCVGLLHSLRQPVPPAVWDVVLRAPTCPRQT